MILIYAAEIVELKWYESAFFKAFIQIVGLAITVMTVGAAQPVVMGIMEFAKQVVITIAIAMIARYIIKQIGGILGILVAVVAIAVLAQLGLGIQFAGLTTAEQLMFAVRAVTFAVNQQTAIRADELQDDMNDFDKTKEEKEQELQEAAEAVGYTTDIMDDSPRFDPLWIINRNAPNWYESPDDFFERTIHTGNPGVIAMDAISEYHTNNLSLPDPVFGNAQQSTQFG